MLSASSVGPKDEPRAEVPRFRAERVIPVFPSGLQELLILLSLATYRYGIFKTDSLSWNDSTNVGGTLPALLAAWRTPMEFAAWRAVVELPATDRPSIFAVKRQVNMAQ